jgi:uncharacterized membrane protein YozB (DUF420 family)
MTARPFAKLLRALVGLYPRPWRERYEDEYIALIEDLAVERLGFVRLRLAADIARGALDAHLERRYAMRLWSDSSFRRGIWAGLALAAALAVDVILTVVIFPAGPDESDSDPEYVVQILAAYAIFALVLVAVGAWARRHSEAHWSGVKAGAAAALVFGVSLVVVYSIVNNVFFAIVSQQHDKRVAFAQSGWTSMRAFINMQLLSGIPVVLPMLTILGGLLGGLGGLVLRRRPAASP